MNILTSVYLYIGKGFENFPLFIFLQECWTWGNWRYFLAVLGSVHQTYRNCGLPPHNRFIMNVIYVQTVVSMSAFKSLKIFF